MPIKEYGQVAPEEVSKVTVLSAFKGVVLGETVEWQMKHHTAGYEMAGSAMRYTPEKVSVTYFSPRFNSTHGRSFTDIIKACAYFGEEFKKDKARKQAAPTAKETE